MAQTGTSTTTGTESIPRKQAILEALYLTQRFLGLNEMTKYIVHGVANNEWISKFYIQTLNGEGAIEQELVLEIDWDEYDLKLSTGQEKVEVRTSKGIVQSLSPEYLRLLSIFSEAVVYGRGEKHQVLIGYRSEHSESARTFFGTRPTGELRKAEGFSRVNFGELSELSAQVSLSASANRPSVEKQYTGIVKKLSPHFGFLRPDDWDSKPDFWFPRNRIKFDVREGDRVSFLGVINSRGKFEAKNIKKV
jgi:hypothetical protein